MSACRPSDGLIPLGMVVEQSNDGTAGTEIGDSPKQESRYKPKHVHLRGIRHPNCIGVGIDNGASGVLVGGFAGAAVGKLSLFVSTSVPLFLYSTY